MPVGVLGAESGMGARFDRTRIATRLGGEVLRSIADAERFDGGAGGRGPFIAGDAVCALAGGGAGGVAFVASAPAALFTHLLRSLS